MKVQRIDFKNEQPTVITAELTIEELALVVKLTGRESGTSLMDEHLGRFIDANSTLYDGGVRVFNTYYENGVEGYLRGDTE